MRYSASTRSGRGHRRANLPCQDAYAVRVVPGRGVVFAVADGLGSCELSHIGSSAAAEAAVERLASEAKWGVRAMLRAMRSARRAVRLAATQHNRPVRDLSTTLQLGILTPNGAHVAMVGDGGFIAGADEPIVVLAPGPGGYANEVTPVTGRWWRLSFEYAEQPGAKWLFGFSDGLTRLLMEKSASQWQAFEPFFASVIPRLGESGDDLAERFLQSENVDASWDDDKCLVVVHGNV